MPSFPFRPSAGGSASSFPHVVARIPYRERLSQMAALEGVVTFSAVALTAATERTVVQLVAPSNHRIKITEFGLGFDGTSSTAVPTEVKIARQSTAGTMSAATPVKVDDSLAEAIQTTAQHSATAEPTTGDVLRRLKVHPQAGVINPIPFGREIICGGGDRIAILINAPANVNVSGYIQFEE